MDMFHDQPVKLAESSEIAYLIELGITRESCIQFLYDYNNEYIYKGHTYTSDAQLWILYDTHPQLHANFKVGATDHKGKILRDILKVDISDMISYVRNKKIDSIIK